jgi:uncharacterized phage-associated protein
MGLTTKVNDVAATLIGHLGPIDTFKLQKLLYYCQAWHLVWERTVLFPNRIEAWANGPVIPDVYKQHAGMYLVKGAPVGSDPKRLTLTERSTVKAVVEYYGKKPGHVLAALTHREAPWRDARASGNLGPGERGKVEITPKALLDYYEGLL